MRGVWWYLTQRRRDAEREEEKCLIVWLFDCLIGCLSASPLTTSTEYGILYAKKCTMTED